MLADGFRLWGHPILPAWAVMYKEGRMVGVITPPMTGVPTTPPVINPDQFVPVTATKAWESHRLCEKSQNKFYICKTNGII